MFIVVYSYILHRISCTMYCVQNRIETGIHDPGSRFATTPPPPTWYGPKTCVLQHSAWKRCICSVFCMVGCWRGPQTYKFVGFLQPTFRKRVICNVLASTSWSSAAAPSSISMSICHTSSTAQGGGGSFKNRRRIGEIDCCEWRMSEQKHWPTD